MSSRYERRLKGEKWKTLPASKSSLGEVLDWRRWKKKERAELSGVWSQREEEEKNRESADAGECETEKVGTAK